MNIADSDYMAGILEDCGCIKTDEPDASDIIVINTCTVRQHAEDRAVSYLGTLKKLKEKKPHLKIYFAGCAASLLTDEKELRLFTQRFPFVDGIIPAGKLNIFRGIVGKLLSDSPATREANNIADVRRSSEACEFVTISHGCSNYCSYCIVPYTRGPLISRPPSEIISEITFLIKHRNITDITLLGQNVNSYKWQDVNFADLLKKISAIEGLETVGFLTSHPKDMNEEIIETVAVSNKIRKSFHLPLQSGSDRILSLMNRGYTAAHYKNLVGKIRSSIPDAIITTDIIVGFPTETDEDFEKTLSLLKDMRFENFFAFKYSPRPGTAAAAMPDDIPLEIKEERLQRLLAVIKKPAQEKNQ